MGFTSFSSEDLQRSHGFVMQDVARLMRRNFNRHVENRKLGLTQAQWQALAHIYRNQGLRQATLADILETQPITIARLIDRMQASGWVERRPDPTDRRAVALYLTDKVSPILEEMWNLASAARAEALEGIDDADREKLIEILTKIRANLIKHGDKK